MEEQNTKLRYNK